MSQIIAANAFKVVEGRPVTSSRIVAEYFGKQHHHVVRDIRTLISQKPDLERNANFGECSETINLANGATRQVPFFWMDRKGFSLLAMGFTGAKALDFKCAFYDQFERMEEALRAPSDQSALITTTEQYEIRKTIKSRAKNSSVHYQTVYNALYDYFKIASYKDLRHDQMKAALALIETCTLKPQLSAPAIPEGSIVIDEAMAEKIVVFIYYWRYLFRDDLNLFLALLRRVKSPLAAHFWEAVNDLGLGFMEDALAKQGYSVKDLSCYQHWASQQPKRLTA
mgnify:CR=1 FL=1